MAKVLIVEDDAEIRAAYTFALARGGHTVLEAADGNEAIQMLNTKQPEIVILDMLMPGVSGLDFLRQMEIKTRFPDTKVIAFSNIDTPRVIEQAKALGANEYLIKVEVTPHQMLDIVNRYVAQAS